MTLLCRETSETLSGVGGAESEPHPDAEAATVRTAATRARRFRICESLLKPRSAAGCVSATLAAVARDRWATFDCYGTLIDWNGGIRRELARVFGEEHADRLLTRYHVSSPSSRQTGRVPTAKS